MGAAPSGAPACLAARAWSVFIHVQAARGSQPHLSAVQDRLGSAAGFVLPGIASRIPWEFPFVLCRGLPKVLVELSRAHPVKSDWPSRDKDEFMRGKHKDSAEIQREEASLPMVTVFGCGKGFLGYRKKKKYWRGTLDKGPGVPGHREWVSTARGQEWTGS